MHNDQILSEYLQLPKDQKVNFLKKYFLTQDKSENDKADLFSMLHEYESDPKFKVAALKLLNNIKVNIKSMKKNDQAELIPPKKNINSHTKITQETELNKKQSNEIKPFSKYDFESSDPKVVISSIKQAFKNKNITIFDKISELATIHENPKVRYFAKKGVDALLKIKNENEPLPEGPVTKIIKKAPPKTKYDRLKEVMETGTPDIRNKAVLAIIKENDNKYFPLITDNIKKEDDPHVLASMISSIGNYGDESHIDLLSKYCNHKNYRIQANTIEALGKIGSDKIIPLIVSFLDSNDNRIKGNAIIALKDANYDMCIDTLENMMMSDEIELQASALYCIDTLGEERALKLLELGLESDKEIQEKVKEILSKYKESGIEAVDEILKLMKSAPVEKDVSAIDEFSNYKEDNINNNLEVKNKVKDKKSNEINKTVFKVLKTKKKPIPDVTPNIHLNNLDEVRLKKIIFEIEPKILEELCKYERKTFPQTIKNICSEFENAKIELLELNGYLSSLESHLPDCRHFDDIIKDLNDKFKKEKIELYRLAEGLGENCLRAFLEKKIKKNDLLSPLVENHTYLRSIKAEIEGLSEKQGMVEKAKAKAKQGLLFAKKKLAESKAVSLNKTFEKELIDKKQENKFIYPNTKFIIDLIQEKRASYAEIQKIIEKNMQEQQIYIIQIAQNLKLENEIKGPSDFYNYINQLKKRIKEITHHQINLQEQCIEKLKHQNSYKWTIPDIYKYKESLIIIDRLKNKQRNDKKQVFVDGYNQLSAKGTKKIKSFLATDRDTNSSDALSNSKEIPKNEKIFQLFLIILIVHLSSSSNNKIVSIFMDFYLKLKSFVIYLF